MSNTVKIDRAEALGRAGSDGPLTPDTKARAAALRRIADHLDIPPWISPAEIAWQVIDEIDRLRELANEASELDITDTNQSASARVDEDGDGL